MNNEIAIIFKLKVSNNKAEYVPVKVVTGYYDYEYEEFVDDKGTPYFHIIDGSENYGYAGRRYIDNYAKNYPLVPVSLLKLIILNTAKKYTYLPAVDDKTETPVIYMTNKNKKKHDTSTIYIDEDSFSYYSQYYPKFIKEVINKDIIEVLGDNKEKELAENNQEVKYEVDVKKLYNEITNNVIDQDEPIKKILTAIWKQYNGFSENKSRNILINGSTGVGKTEIFRNITRLIDVPCVMTSATQYTAAGYIGKSVEDMLVSLLDKADGDVEKAQKGILIIDELDKLAESSNNSQVNQRDVQEALLKLIEDSKFDIDYHHQTINFDTSKLMVVGMGSWSRIKFEEVKHIGFGAVSEKKEYKDLTSEDIIANGMIPELIGRFPVIVQMNELNKNSFVRILNKAQNNALNLNKRFFESQGVKLSLDDETLEIVAEEAIKNKLGARSLDTIIEKALAVASFEIASNPNLYDELIITKDTISDNKKYVLRKNQENKESIK